MADRTKDLRNVIIFALADGEFSDDERTFAEAMASRLGMTDAELAELTAGAEAGGSKLRVSRDADEARELIQLLVDTAAADRIVTDKERRLLKRIAQHVDMDETLLRQMIDDALATGAVDDAEIERQLEDIYAHFNDWDSPTRTARLDEFARLGHQAVDPLLRLLESYRIPDGADNALELKRLVASRLGDLGDGRAAYYLVQHVNIGHQEDEITSPALRYAAAEALGKITGKGFGPNDEGIQAVQAWWSSSSAERVNYDKLAL
ncbi:MAG: tellurite resistance TerB family protein [Planctomycetota bacterium]|jgi:tellurite resistance protein